MALMSLRVTCTCVFFSILMLSGCSGSLNQSLGSQGRGAVPTVTAVALQVNGAAPNRKQEVQFSEAMDPTTINAQSFQVTSSSGMQMPGSVTYDSNLEIASFLPNPALQSDATYTVTITTASTSADGMHLASPYTYTFATRATTDSSPISVLSVSPAQNATCVSATAPIVVTFDEAPDAATVVSGNFLVTGPGGAIPVKLSTNVTTTQVVLTPASSLPSGNISVTVNNVADLAGVAMTVPFTWSFSTACGGGGGTAGGATIQYMAPLFSESALDTKMNGQISVDTSGNTTVQLSGATAGSTFTVQFCPGFDAGSTIISAPACFNVTTISTDTSGNGTATVKFPQSGDWAGDFYLDDSGGKTQYQTFVSPTASTETFLATLLPATKTNGGAVAINSPQDPLTSGTVSYAKGSLQFIVQGALTSTAYSADDSETTYMDSSGTYRLGTFTTNANGNGSLTTTITSPGGDLLQVKSQTQKGGVTGNFTAGFIGGFSVLQ